MNYIILNGKKSTLIKGLLIQSLPHISKPLIRTQIEEIDGRDGDIVTKLGYSAYDKEFTIGLYGDYDINEVIAYFDSQGQVIFSNESDKYYNYQIIDQIDFERLIRFKTATVTMHVQPFKYSAVEKPVTAGNLLNIPDQTMTKNGVTLTVSGNTVSVRGTASTATEVYMPIPALSLKAGDYAFMASASGTGCSACAIRLINGVPSDAESLGGTFIRLSDGVMQTLDATLAQVKSFNYLWFYINAGTAMDITFTPVVVGDQLTISNMGNIASKPALTIYGTGLVNLYLNGSQIFAINMTTDFITIDAEAMEAYMGEVLLNRNVVGDYDNLALNIGQNVISWTGDVSEVSIDKYSRWI